MSYEIKTKNSWLSIYKFINRQLMIACCEEIKGKLLVKPEIVVFNKVCNQNRNVGFFSDDSIGYRYSGRLAASQPLTPALKELLDTINSLYDTNFNGILVNEYPDGNHTIGAHSDDESGLGSAGVVAISMGVARKFRIRTKHDKKIYKDIEMGDMDMIHMGGDFQKEFTHEIPVQKRVSGARISFTFRHHTE